MPRQFPAPVIVNERRMSMRFTLLFLVVTLLLSPTHAAAQSTPLTSDVLLEKIAAIRDDLSLVAMGATVLVDGNIVARAACGNRRQNSDVAVTVDDRWHLGSITKSMTATVIGRLIDRGELTLNDTLPKLLPKHADDFDPSWQKVTLHQVLTHAAGLPANFRVGVQFKWTKDLQKRHETRRSELLAILAKPSASPPGEKHVYSNVGYTLAGFIAAETRETTWEELIRAELFEPLQLKSAGFGPPRGAKPLDQPWGHVRALFFRTPADPKSGGDNSPVIGPAGIVHMSMNDLAKFGWEHLQGESTDTALLKRETFQKLHTPIISDYGCGWVSWKRNWAEGRMIWHNGSNTMWYSLLVLLPSKNAVIVIVTNDAYLQKVQPACFELTELIAHTLPTATKQNE